MERTLNAVLAAGAAIAAFVGLVDAIVSREADFAAVFALILALSAVQLGGLAVRRRSVRVRRDLFRWYSDRAGISGERIDILTDRALAAYRAELTSPSS